MNFALGLGTFVFGIYLATYGITTHDDVGLALWGKAILCLTAGLGVTAYNSVGFVKTVLEKLKKGKEEMNKAPEVVEKDVAKDESVAGISVAQEQTKDINSVFYLTERVKSSPEGLELCRKLNDLIFSLHHKNEEKK